MFASQNQTPNVIDSLNGNLEDWYNACDASIKKSDVIPGNYEYTVNTSYGNVGNILEGSSTHFDISVDRFKICSLENSYITMKQHLQLNLPNIAAGDILTWYVGYKSSFDAIAQYRIYSNSDHVQTQNHANYEWFMIYNSLGDEAKNNSECFATFDKINSLNQFVPGTYITLHPGGAVNNAVIEFDVKIPLSSFLMLYNLKYFPHWAGKLTIEIYPSYKNIVVCPVVGNLTKSPVAFNANLVTNPQSLTAIGYNDSVVNTNTFNVGFTQINQAQAGNNFNFGGGAGVAQIVAGALFSSNGDGCYFTDCKIRLATYLLKIELANALTAKYTEFPLVFPIQTTQIKDFTSALPVVANQHFTTANTIALKHCDAMFIVFKNGVHARTVFNNPFLSTFRVNVDGKFYPREELATFNDKRFMNLTLDALNINNNPCTSISNDLANSLQPFTCYKNFIANGALNAGANGALVNPAHDNKIWKIGDQSNFMIGIPFCDSDDFMGGISSLGTVQIELSGQIENICPARQYQATAICFEDCYLKIRAMKPDGRPQIEITNATMEQMSLGGL